LRDQDTLKADLENGYTPIANLILEALAISKMNGTQKGICLFLLRRTYGWGTKEDDISLKEFAEAVDSSPSYVSKQLKQLIEWNVIIRTSYSPGKTAAYTFNTRVAEWDKGCTNVQGLDECIRQGLYKRARVGLYECARVDKAPSLDNSLFDPPLKKDINKVKESITSTIEKTPYKELVDLYHETCPSLPRVRTISSKRKTHIKARYEQHNRDLSVFRELFKKAEASDFLTGRQKSGNPKYQNFQADFDWLMNEHNMAKVLEGKYINRARGDPLLTQPQKQTIEEKLRVLEGY
jgi:phage replication O-like protein O